MSRSGAIHVRREISQPKPTDTPEQRLKRALELMSRNAPTDNKTFLHRLKCQVAADRRRAGE